jgi:hypothetical protein
MAQPFTRRGDAGHASVVRELTSLAWFGDELAEMAS